MTTPPVSSSSKRSRSIFPSIVSIITSLLPSGHGIDPLDQAVSHPVDLLPHADHEGRVVGDDLQPLPDPEPLFRSDLRVPILDDRGLRGDFPQIEVRPPLHRTEAWLSLPEKIRRLAVLDERIGPEGLVTAVDHDISRIGGAHHRADQRDRARLPRVRERPDMPEVADNAVPRG